MNFGTALSICFLSAVLGIFPLTAVEAVQASSEDLKKVEQKVLQQSLEHKKLQAQATQINLELNAVSKEMVKAAKKIQNNEEKLSLMEKQLQFLEDDLKTAQIGFDKEDDNLIKTLAALQNLALKPTESLLVQPLNPVDIIRSAMVLRETVPYLEKNANEIRKKLQDIKEKKARVEKQILEISKQKNVLQAEHDQMRKLFSRKSKLHNTLEVKSEQTKKNIDKLASQAQDLRDFLSKLEKQRIEKAKKDAERRKQENKRKLEEKQSADLIKSKQADIIHTISGFAKAKGNLALPARGQIIVHYGEQKVKGVTSKGITIATRNNAQVIAPFDGSVIFAGPFRGYGNMIIVEHGEGFLSLMSGLDNIDVELGQMILAGEPVGQMPAQNNAELYVEIRKNNHPINPTAWFKF